MPEAKRPLKVFLSYASQDRPLVRELSRRLVGEGWIDTWVDEKSLLPGQDWRVKIEEAVEEADVVIICLSNHSVSKEGHVQKELRYAREIALEKPDETIFLIPLRLDECEVPRGLRFYQWVDYFGDAKNNSYDALVKSLKLRYEQKIKLEEIENSREEQARLEAEELARRKAEKEKVEREVGEKATREKAEQRAYQLALLRKNVRRPFAFLKSNIVISPSKLRIAGFVGIVIAVLGLGFWGARQPKWPFPTKSPSATITLPTTDATVVATKVSMEVKDSSGSTMIFIPEGKFIMGIDNSFSDEKPAHSVELASFYMDKNEVTNSQYKTCVAAGVCKRPFYTNLYYKLERDNHPVVTVDWDMALTFCKWRGGSLPTEAQWEKAARGEEEYTYPWGEVTPIVQYANFQGTDTKDVGSYPSVRSPYGILDLAGNVSEWVYDWYSPEYYQTVFLENISNPSGPLVSPYEPSHNYYGRVIRGGSWKTINISELSTTYRYRLDPSLYADDLGFRCVKNTNP